MRMKLLGSTTLSCVLAGGHRREEDDVSGMQYDDVGRPLLTGLWRFTSRVRRGVQAAMTLRPRRV